MLPKNTDYNNHKGPSVNIILLAAYEVKNGGFRMSAFMMSNESLAKITAYVHRKIVEDKYRLDYNIQDIIDVCREYEKANNKVVNTEFVSYETLYRVLELMNAESLKQRYGDTIEENISKSVPAIPFWGYLNKVEIYKLLNCYTYQCCEGNVPETKLYKAIKQLETDLCHSIVRAMPEYEAAPWG